MQNRRICPDSLSKLLATCAIWLFAVGHVLPVTIVQGTPFSGWIGVRDLLWDDFPRLANRAWTHSLDAQDWLELAFFAFLPLFWLGIAGFFLMERSRPRT